MNTEVENNTEEKTNEIKVMPENKNEKLLTAPMIICVCLYLSIAFGISWVVGMNEHKKELERIENEIKEEANQDKEKDPTELEDIKLSIDSTGSLSVLTKSSSQCK